VAEAAVGLVGSRRVVRTLPGWRGAVIRGGAVAPTALNPNLFTVATALGRRAMRHR